MVTHRRRTVLQPSLLVCVAYFLPLAAASPAGATDPNPLQAAYWRFEEGSPGSLVDASTPDPVLDSVNANHLDAFSSTSAPTYASIVPPTALQSGLPNNLALDFIDIPGEGDDLFTTFADDPLTGKTAKVINNGLVPTGSGFTIEAAFRPVRNGAFQALVAKEGQPVLGELGGAFIENLPTLALKLRGDNDLLQIELFDGAANLVQVSSLDAIITGQWYYAAVVSSGSQLSLYLDRNDGAGYVLQGSVATEGAIFQGRVDGDYNENGIVDAADFTVWRDNFGAPAGSLPNDPVGGVIGIFQYDVWTTNFGATRSWDHSWTVGRGQFGGVGGPAAPADFYDGIIDEVRISNTVLSPSEFLFAPAPADMVPEPNLAWHALLACCALTGFRFRGSGRRRKAA